MTLWSMTYLKANKEDAALLEELRTQDTSQVTEEIEAELKSIKKRNSDLQHRRDRARHAYESGVDTSEEYKERKETMAEE